MPRRPDRTISKKERIIADQWAFFCSLAEENGWSDPEKACDRAFLKATELCYYVEYSDEDERFVATARHMGINAHGKTREEAMYECTFAVSLYLEANRLV